MKKVIFITFVFIIILNTSTLYSVDMKKIKCTKEMAEKYWTKHNGRARFDEVAFIRGEVKRLKAMNLSEDELYEIINSDEAKCTATRIAALRLWIKKKGKDALPELKEMKDYYERKSKEHGYSLPPSVYMQLSSHLSKAILLVQIKDMSCLNRIKFLLDSYKEEGIMIVLSHQFRLCNKEKGFNELIRNEYKNAVPKKRSSIINLLGLAKIPLAKEYIEIGLKDNDFETIAGAMSACWTIYKRDCIPKIEEVLKDPTKDEKIKTMGKKFINAIQDHDDFLDNLLEEYPLDYGE